MDFGDILICAMMFQGLYKTEMLRSKQLDLSEAIKNKIFQEGLYHITTKETAEQIVESGYLLPSQGILDNHFAKSRYGDGFANFVYMFAGKPSKRIFTTNSIHMKSEDGTIYAVKHTPNKYELNNYTERLSDGAITYEGRLDISNSNPELVRMRLEKGKIVEIPWNEPVKQNTFQKFRTSSMLRILKAIPPMTKEVLNGMLFVDTNGNLKQLIRERRALRQIIQQYNNDRNPQNFEVSKNGIGYTISSIGTKMNDGRLLTGFRVSQQNGDLEKNLFMETMDFSTISEKDLQTFLVRHMNEGTKRSEYIGRAVVGEYGVFQQMDQEYAHHFYQKQLMTVKNDSTYAQYIREEQEKKKKQLGRFKEVYENTTTRTKKDVMYYLRIVKERVKENFKGIIDSEKGK